MKKCLFCERSSKFTREHIIPQWLLKELEIPYEEMRGTHFSWMGTINSLRKHRFNKLVSGSICKDCNNGWLSDLENSVKDIIIGVINLKKESLDGLINNRELIVRWIIKTAIILNYSTNYRKLVPLEHFHAIYRSEIPQNIYVNLAFTNDIEKKLYWQQSQTLVVTGEKERINYIIPKRLHYKITFQFNCLLLRICYFPFEDFTLNTLLEKSISLWPELARYAEFDIFNNIGDFDIRCFFIQKD